MVSRISNEQREAIVREAVAKRDALLAGPMTDDNAGQRITDMLMECAERLGNFPRAEVDPRAWQHLLVYAPTAGREIRKLANWLISNGHDEARLRQIVALAAGVLVSSPPSPLGDTPDQQEQKRC